MEGARNGTAPAENAVRISPTRGPDRVRSTMLRFFASGATRSQLSTIQIRRLDDIRKEGASLLKKLEPYQFASVFDLEFSEALYGGASFEDVKTMAHDSLNVTRKQLDAASAQIMPEMFINYPETDNPELETTCTIAALYFVAAVARFGPELIFESLDGGEEKRQLADRFLKFFDQEVSRFMDEGNQWGYAREYHDAVYQLYQLFKAEMPGLLGSMKQKFLMDGELLAPYGNEDFSFSWASMHYDGAL
jgi:hypothetical protein